MSLFGDDPGDDGEGENGEEELIQDGSPTTEREIVDPRTLQHAKLDPIPNTAARFQELEEHPDFVAGSVGYQWFGLFDVLGISSI